MEQFVINYLKNRNDVWTLDEVLFAVRSEFSDSSENSNTISQVWEILKKYNNNFEEQFVNNIRKLAKDAVKTGKEKDAELKVSRIFLALFKYFVAKEKEGSDDEGAKLAIKEAKEIKDIDETNGNPFIKENYGDEIDYLYHRLYNTNINP